MRPLRNAVLVAAAMLLAGCGTLSDAQLETREYRRVDFQERFLQYQRQCLAAGRHMIIEARQKIARNELPRPGDRYHCT